MVGSASAAPAPASAMGRTDCHRQPRPGLSGAGHPQRGDANIGGHLRGPFVRFPRYHVRQHPIPVGGRRIRFGDGARQPGGQPADPLFVHVRLLGGQQRRRREPAAPTNFSGGALSSTQISLSSSARPRDWLQPVRIREWPARAHRFLRRRHNVGYSQRPVPGSTYAFNLVASNSAGSAATPWIAVGTSAAANVQVPAPQNLQAVATSSVSVQLSWRCRRGNGLPRVRVEWFEPRAGCQSERGNVDHDQWIDAGHRGLFLRLGLQRDELGTDRLGQRRAAKCCDHAVGSNQPVRHGHVGNLGHVVLDRLGRRPGVWHLLLERCAAGADRHRGKRLDLGQYFRIDPRRNHVLRRVGLQQCHVGRVELGVDHGTGFQRRDERRSRVFAIPDRQRPPNGPHLDAPRVPSPVPRFHRRPRLRPSLARATPATYGCAGLSAADAVATTLGCLWNAGRSDRQYCGRTESRACNRSQRSASAWPRRPTSRPLRS